ncbi:hypothetical protein BDK51DRAFT_35105, partial [Blyttiomyces helicus]
TNLQILDLTGVPLSSNAAQWAAKAATRSHSLKELLLRGIGLGRDGASFLADYMRPKVKFRRRLKVIDLSENDLTPTSVSKLFAALAKCEYLQTLDLGGNRFYNNHSRSAFIALLSLPHLRVLRLREAYLCSAGAKDLAAALTESSARLTRMDLSKNGILDDAAEALVDILDLDFAENLWGVNNEALLRIENLLSERGQAAETARIHDDDNSTGEDDSSDDDGGSDEDDKEPTAASPSASTRAPVTGGRQVPGRVDERGTEGEVGDDEKSHGPSLEEFMAAVKKRSVKKGEISGLKYYGSRIERSG